MGTWSVLMKTLNTQKTIKIDRRAGPVTCTSTQISITDGDITLFYCVGLLSIESTHGPAALSGARWWNFFITVLYFSTVLLFSQYAINLQFLYRYYSLCR